MAVFQPLPLQSSMRPNGEIANGVMHVATSDTEASHFINHVHTATYRPLSTRSPRNKTRTESTDSNTPSSIGDESSSEDNSDAVASTPGSHDASHSNCRLS